MSQAPLEAARKLAPQIRASADEIDRLRELPRALFEAIADAGLFHLAVPRAIGGGEIDLPTYVQVIEELGKADASTGWVVNQGAIYGTYAARMPREAARKIWIDPPRAVVANTPAATAKAIEKGPLYKVPRTLCFASGDAAVALGMARTCLETFAELAGSKTPRAMPSLLREQSMVQVSVGQCEAWLRSGRAFLMDAVRDIWDAATRGAVTLEQRANLRIATTHGIRLAAQIIDTAYNASGATAAYEDHLIQRHFQDIHVITQHLQGRLAHYEMVGRYWLGLPIDEARI